MIKIFALHFVVALSIGCSSISSEPLIVGWKFTGGPFEDALTESFGDGPTESGINFYVLPNAWAAIEPNGLSFTAEHVYYVETIRGEVVKYESNVAACAELSAPVAEFFEQLNLLVPYSWGDLEYSDPPYLDGPDYVFEVHGETADLVIEPKSFARNFPLVVSAYRIINTVRKCR